MDDHEARSHGETGIGPAHRNPHGRRLLENSCLDELYPLDQDHENHTSHEQMDQDLQKSSFLIGYHSVKKVEPKMTTFLKSKGSADDREPYEKIARQLFGPIKRLDQDITIDDLKKDDQGHHRDQDDQHRSFCFGQEIVEPRQGA